MKKVLCGDWQQYLYRMKDLYRLEFFSNVSKSCASCQSKQTKAKFSYFYLETSGALDWHRCRFPTLAHITRQGPDDLLCCWNVSSLVLDEYVQCTDTASVHVIPEPQTIVGTSRYSREPFTDESSFITTFSWRRCFDVHVFACKKCRCNCTFIPANYVRKSRLK